MKRNYALYIVLAASMASCSKEQASNEAPELPDSQVDMVEVEFTAFDPDASGDQTKTHVDTDGKTIIWQASDKISVFANGNNYEFTTQDSGTSATFKGTMTAEDAAAEVFYALYPYSETATIADGVITTSAVPNSQNAVTGTFANGVNQSAAKAEGGSKNFVFKNLCAVIRFTIPEELGGLLKMVMISANGGEKFVNGTVSVNLKGTTPVMNASGATGADVLVKNDEGLESGVYYMPVCPVASLTKGLRAKLEYKDGRTPEYIFSGKASSFVAGKIFRFGTIYSQPTYILDDFESYYALPKYITGNDGALSVIDNPFRTDANSSSKVLSNYMEKATWSTSGFVQMAFGSDSMKEAFPYAARDKFKAVRFKIYIGKSEYYPTLKYDANGSYGNEFPSKVNGVASTADTYGSLLKHDDWNTLEFNLSDCGYKTTNFANLNNFQLRPFVKSNKSNCDAALSETNRKICYIDDVEFLYK